MGNTWPISPCRCREGDSAMPESQLTLTSTLNYRQRAIPLWTYEEQSLAKLLPQPWVTLILQLSPLCALFWEKWVHPGHYQTIIWMRRCSVLNTASPHLEERHIRFQSLWSPRSELRSFESPGSQAQLPIRTSYRNFYPNLSYPRPWSGGQALGLWKALWVSRRQETWVAKETLSKEQLNNNLGKKSIFFSFVLIWKTVCVEKHWCVCKSMSYCIRIKIRSCRPFQVVVRGHISCPCNTCIITRYSQKLRVSYTSVPL